LILCDICSLTYPEQAAMSREPQITSLSMPLQFQIVSEHSEIVGDDATRSFNGGGTIGRSLQNDWILPDPDRFISGRHATVDFKGGIYYLADVSANGVYINDDCEPIGKGNPRRLFSGDKVRMGDFEMLVSIDEGEDLVMPEEPMASVVPDNIEQLVPEELLKTGVQLLDEEELTGDDEFQSALFGGSFDGTMDEAAPSMGEPSNHVTPIAEAAAAISSDPSGFSADDLFDSFLDGLGISRAELHQSVDQVEAMQNAGQVLREFVAGTSKLLVSRANLKNAFRLDQTTVLPRHNNPLKLSANTNDSIKQLLIGREGEYLGPQDAVREVCSDLLCHQDAFIDAMNNAFLEFADRFDPDELSEGFDRTMSPSRLFKFMKKAKYWDLYCDLYPIMTEKGGGRFPQMYAEEFVKAYERQIAEYKRLAGGEPNLAKTVVLDQSDVVNQRNKTASQDEQNDNDDWIDLDNETDLNEQELRDDSAEA
jgi:type VI secretion system FHA domain protein